MASRNETIRYAFNRGVISPLALARIDLKRNALSAAIQENWMPRALGSMMLRPGLGYLGQSNANAPGRHVEFVRSISAMYVLEFTPGAMRIWNNDALITRPAVTAAVTNGTFPVDLAGWTDNDEGGAASAWAAGGYMGLTGNGTAAAIRDQVVVCNEPNVEHALRVTIARGPVTIRVGTATTDDVYVQETTLETGSHSLAFTPAGNFNVRFMSILKRLVLVDSCTIEAAGAVVLPSPYQAADLDYIRANSDSLSVDVLFVGCVSYQQRRIERRQSGRSWSIALYRPEDGPFRVPNVSTITMTASAIAGNGTLTASRAYFRNGHVGALFRLASTGQTVTKNMTLINDVTNSIRVIGINTDRTFSITLVGMTVGRTVVLEYSTDNLTWIPVPTKSWTADTAEAFSDGFNNQIIYYRLKCTVVGAAGPTVATLSIPTGSIIGTARVTGYTSATVVDVEILADFGATTATLDWMEGKWSDFRGWPSAGALFEGRLIWGGFDAINESVTDAFDSFEPNTVGDSGPINRTIGSGPMDSINWVLPLQRVVMGAILGEHSIRSNAFDEPITPSNFNRKGCSTQGSAAVQAVKVDSRGMYVQRGGTRIFELAFDSETFDYGSKDATILNPDICKPQVKRMAVQRRPDTRLHCVLADGTAAVMVWDHAEQITCWVKVTTEGSIIDVVILPGIAGSSEDQVYYQVKRTLPTGTVYYFEKWAIEDDCQGGRLNKQADAFVTGAGAVNTLSHLEGMQVVCWRDGICEDDGAGMPKLYTVAGGAINVPGNGPWVAGLYYEARLKTAKLGQTISHQGAIDHFAPVLYNTHARGLFYGQDFDVMDNLPLMYRGAPVDLDRVYDYYDEQDQEFPGTWSPDARLCLKAVAPRPCTVLAVQATGQMT